MQVSLKNGVPHFFMIADFIIFIKNYLIIIILLTINICYEKNTFINAACCGNAAW